MLQDVFLLHDRFFFSRNKAMAEMGDSNLNGITVAQQAMASCCGAIITSLCGKANSQACHRENLSKMITLQFDSA